MVKATFTREQQLELKHFHSMDITSEIEDELVKELMREKQKARKKKLAVIMGNKNTKSTINKKE